MPSVQDQDQDFASQDQDQDQDLFVVYTRGWPKSIFHFGRKQKYRRKWNSNYGRKRKENEHSFSAEKKRKRKSPDNICFFFFFIHSVTKSALQCAANSSFAFLQFFLQVVLVDGHQPGHPSVGRRNEYWRWLRPPLGKKTASSA